mmetsp:Transcript_11515/g.15010  ORF Transcript_11515/g.15010 Transcript_11515/m.15010 type:complete len:172 (-) Transcript_11515:959-1474(-)
MTDTMGERNQNSILPTLVVSSNQEDTRWKSMYSSLHNFYERYGHTIVPVSDTELCNWCKEQRIKHASYKKKKLSKSEDIEEQFRKLKLIDFSFHPPSKSTEIWHKMYNQYVDHLNIYGNKFTHSRTVRDRTLGSWVSSSYFARSHGKKDNLRICCVEAGRLSTKKVQDARE